MKTTFVIDTLLLSISPALAQNSLSLPPADDPIMDFQTDWQAFSTTLRHLAIDSNAMVQELKQLRDENAELKASSSVTSPGASH